MSLPRNKVTFWTEAGPDAPDEVKGTNKYFRPERMEWSVSLAHRDDQPYVHVAAHGSATRVPMSQGIQGWTVTGRFADPLPDWIDAPWDDIDTVAHALRAITDKLKEQE